MEDTTPHRRNCHDAQEDALIDDELIGDELIGDDKRLRTPTPRDNDLEDAPTGASSRSTLKVQNDVRESGLSSHMHVMLKVVYDYIIYP